MKTAFAVSNRLRRGLALGALVLAGWLPSVPAAQTNAPARPPGGRYLIIVETSSAMKKRAENTQLMLGNLIANGLNGQLREGDTIGVWTFRDELFTGQLPLLRWNPQARQRSARSLVDFLRAQKYEKKADLTKVTQAFAPLITNSPKLTVLIVTEGSTKISGTPYDAEINAAFKKNSSEQKKKQMPFVTILRVKKGEFIGSTVGIPPWPLEFPAFPPEPKPDVPPKPKTAVVVPPGPKPLIVIGNTNTPPQTPPVAPEITVTPTPQPPLNSIPVASLAPSSPAPTSVLEIPPNPTVPLSVAAEIPKPESPSVPATVPSTPAPNPTETASVAPATSVKKIAPAETAPALQATATPTKSLLNRNNLFIAGGALILGSIIFLIAIMRRPRHQERISLITSTMDPNDK